MLRLRTILAPALVGLMAALPTLAGDPPAGHDHAPQATLRDVAHAEHQVGHPAAGQIQILVFFDATQTMTPTEAAPIDASGKQFGSGSNVTSYYVATSGLETETGAAGPGGAAPDAAALTDRAKAAVTQLKLSGSVLVDPNATFAHQVGVEKTGTAIVIDDTGKIAYTGPVVDGEGSAKVDHVKAAVDAIKAHAHAATPPAHPATPPAHPATPPAHPAHH